MERRTAHVIVPYHWKLVEGSWACSPNGDPSALPVFLKGIMSPLGRPEITDSSFDDDLTSSW